MGISYRAVAMYGKHFHTMSDLKDFVENVYPDAEVVDYEAIYDVPELEGIQIECLDSYSGESFILGYAMELGQTVDEFATKWQAAFPGVEAHPILDVGCS